MCVMLLISAVLLLLGTQCVLLRYCQLLLLLMINYVNIKYFYFSTKYLQLILNIDDGAGDMMVMVLAGAESKFA